MCREVENYCPEVFGMSGAFVAGGFIRALCAPELEIPKDLDLFFTDQASYCGAVSLLSESGWALTNETDHAETFSKESKVVQCCRTYFMSPDVILANFDFSVCAVCFQPKPAEFFVDEFFEQDLAVKRLRVRNTPNPLDTLRRVARYMRYGYKPEPEDIELLQKRIAKQYGNPNSYDFTLIDPTEEREQDSPRAARPYVPAPDEYDPFAD